MMKSFQLARTLRPYCSGISQSPHGLRGMATGSGSGVDASLSSEEKAASEGNMAQNKENQKSRLREMGNDHPSRIFPEPDPTSTAVPGLASESQPEHDSYAANKNTAPPQTNSGNPNAMPKSTAGNAAEKVTAFVKDSYNTLVSGVSNAAQTATQDKPKQS